MIIESSLVDESIWVPILVLGFVAIAVFTDLRSQRIPNWLTVSAFAGALVFHLAVAGWTGLASSFCGFATGFVTLLVLFLIGGGGGGDVKLMGAVGAWIGAWPTLLVFVGSAVFVILIMIGMLIKRGAVANRSLIKPVVKQKLPYAVPVALSLVFFLLLRM